MLIDFETMEETVIPHFKGGEKETAARMFFDGQNRIMRGVLIPGASIGLHTHETGSEIVYILSGKGAVLYDDGRNAGPRILPLLPQGPHPQPHQRRQRGPGILRRGARTVKRNFFQKPALATASAAFLFSI